MKEQLKIAMLGHKRIPSREGGIEIVVEELSVRLVQKGQSVTCYNRSGHHVSGKEFDGATLKAYKGINLKSVFTINCKGLAAMTSSFMAALCCAFSSYDVIHFHAEGPCAMLWLPKFFGKRCIATIHGIDWQRAKWNSFASDYIKFGERVAVKFADEIIVLSESVQKYFMDTYGRKTVFIPNGVSRPKIYDAQLIREKFNLEKDEYVLFLGRVVPEKGLRYLIEAFKDIKTDKKLVIAGGSSDTDAFMQELKELAKDDKRIIFTGFVQGKMLEELYSNTYVYCLPSDLEGMPLSLLEAMSYGNCCLTSDISECVEVVENKAVTFKKSDIIDLGKKLQMMCENTKAVEKYKKEAAEFICNKYNWDNVAGETLKLYRKKR
ncbi:glycosyltransferase family 4 protein [Enterocloster citroniae]|uniref:glycosyltransferase family 4 protein n=1 Tax=Enterocloster citroniae TaxID=358743 RepID=UPI0008EFA000|nr:glycosyltransferase family 4 protein [Enterocloster citroniae]SFR95381.1 Glycosyltransferase involved in cell wall bisynthesis [Enterocloster citroniae]